MRADGSTAQNYTPEARPFNNNDLFWTMLRDKKKEYTDEWLELDLYEYSEFAVKKLVSEGDDTALRSLYHTSISGKLSHP